MKNKDGLTFWLASNILLCNLTGLLLKKNATFSLDTHREQTFLFLSKQTKIIFSKVLVSCALLLITTEISYSY